MNLTIPSMSPNYRKENTAPKVIICATKLHYCTVAFNRTPGATEVELGTLLTVKAKHTCRCNYMSILLALGGCSWPSLMHEVTHDFLVVHIKASQKSLGDKPKSVHIFLQTPREVYTRKS